MAQENTNSTKFSKCEKMAGLLLSASFDVNEWRYFYDVPEISNIRLAGCPTDQLHCEAGLRLSNIWFWTTLRGVLWYRVAFLSAVFFKKGVNKFSSLSTVFFGVWKLLILALWSGVIQFSTTLLAENASFSSCNFMLSDFTCVFSFRSLIFLCNPKV